jgi:succinate dehydrogenase / fumarate reductase cytochrome b subunit
MSSNKPTSSNFWKWFNPFPRKEGMYGFTLNRITALGLTLYLYLHLVILGQLALGPEGYDRFLKTIHSPLFVFGEWLVIAASLIHGLNGLRIALTSFGVAIPAQKGLFYGLMVIAVIVSLIFGVRMFSA